MTDEKRGYATDAEALGNARDAPMARPSSSAPYRSGLSIEDMLRCLECRHIPDHRPGPCDAPGCLHGHDVTQEDDARRERCDA